MPCPSVEHHITNVQHLKKQKFHANSPIPRSGSRLPAPNPRRARLRLPAPRFSQSALRHQTSPDRKRFRRARKKCRRAVANRNRTPVWHRKNPSRRLPPPDRRSLLASRPSNHSPRKNARHPRSPRRHRTRSLATRPGRRPRLAPPVHRQKIRPPPNPTRLATRRPLDPILQKTFATITALRVAAAGSSTGTLACATKPFSTQNLRRHHHGTRSPSSNSPTHRPAARQHQRPESAIPKHSATNRQHHPIA